MASTTSIDSEVLAVLDDLYAAWERADPDAIARLYTEEAPVTRPGTFYHGAESVREFFAAGFGGRLAGSRPVDEDRDVTYPADGTAIVTSKSGVLMAGEDTLPPGRVLRATTVLVRRDGRWLIAAYHNCPLNGG
ncbi:MAG TPA: SgcJ/EcaC family oxidoreductase [Streptosporangiaceae bacterium]|nr:SgcJ/EcaC family oxidoreductase [Streptosporangiaceae bacterium]